MPGRTGWSRPVRIREPWVPTSTAPRCSNASGRGWEGEMTPKTITFRQLRHHGEIYLLMIPTVLLIGLFSYYPAASGVFHSFFRWNGADIAEWVGVQNFIDLLRSSAFWDSFSVAFYFGLWNVIKMVPPLLVAVCIHRSTSERLQFFYRG